MKKGLVMEGGAMRGMFTCGVIDVLLENDINLDGAIGVSAGATFGCNYVSKQAGRALRYNKKFSRDPRYGSFKSLIKTGDYFGSFCYKELPNVYDVFDWDTFYGNPTEFWVVATDIESGDPVYHKCETSDDRGDADLQWFRASASMPLFSNIVEIDGDKYLDGGISDAVPLEFFEGIGYEKNIVVLTQPIGYMKKPTKAMPVIAKKYADYPELVDAMKHRHEIYNLNYEYIRERAGAGAALIIAPDIPLSIGRIEKDPEELERVYNIGRKKGTEMLDAIRKFLED